MGLQFSYIYYEMRYMWKEHVEDRNIILYTRVWLLNNHK